MTADLRELIRDTINTHRIRCRRCSGWMIPCSGCSADAVMLVVAGLVELIATGFDERAELAKVADREHRDVDVVLAHQSAARFVRSHAGNRFPSAAAAVSSPTGTPDRPTTEPPFCHRCGHACAHTPPHPLIETPDGPVCEDVAWCTQLQHADEMARICSDCGAARGTHANAGCEACAEYVVEIPNRWPATSPTGDPTP